MHKINTEICLKKRKIRRENMEEIDIKYIWRKEAKTKRISKKLL